MTKRVGFRSKQTESRSRWEPVQVAFITKITSKLQLETRWGVGADGRFYVTEAMYAEGIYISF